jgi:hypothetical protein
MAPGGPLMRIGRTVALTSGVAEDAIMELTTPPSSTKKGITVAAATETHKCSEHAVPIATRADDATDNPR